MNLSNMISAMTPRCFKRASRVRTRLDMAVEHNKEVVEDATREIRKARSTLTRAIILADMRAIDGLFDRGSDE
jgi:hypothetical protein